MIIWRSPTEFSFIIWYHTPALSFKKLKVVLGRERIGISLAVENSWIWYPRYPYIHICPKYGIICLLWQRWWKTSLLIFTLLWVFWAHLKRYKFTQKWGPEHVLVPRQTFQRFENFCAKMSHMYSFLGHHISSRVKLWQSSVNVGIFACENYSFLFQNVFIPQNLAVLSIQSFWEIPTVYTFCDGNSQPRCLVSWVSVAHFWNM